MIPKDCKRLAEVDFPIAVVSKHAVREKSIRHGHPSTLHLWWARRPLGACRAMLLALLLPDPCDEHCPEEFKTKSRELLLRVQGQVGTDDEGLRRGLLRFMGDFANWDLSSNARYLEVARGLVRAAHPDEPPLIVDPFAGGGSIPLEALRLGCEAFASDLNPVACLILKVLLEGIPRYGPELAEELRRVGAEIKEAAENQLTEFYPPDQDGARPIAYLWARTVRCEAPNCGAEMPLMRSFWLCKKASSKWALRYKVVRPPGHLPQVEFEVVEPKTDQEVPAGTVTRAKATCLCCNTVLSPDRVRRQLSDQHGGADVIFDGQGNRIGGARLLAAVILNPGKQGRQYRLPRDRDYRAVHNAMKALEKIAATKLPNDLNPIPDEPLPPIGTLGFRVQRYGMLQWGDLFTARQKLAMITLVHLVRETRCSGTGSHDRQFSQLLQSTLGLGVSKLADLSNSLCSWEPSMTRSVDLFARQVIPMVWDFSETAVLSEVAGNYGVAINNMARIPERERELFSNGYVELASAMEHPLPDESAHSFFTDPPYYDAVPYADLSDFFFVWLKRIFSDHPLLRDPFDPQNPLTPKLCEVVQDETKRVNGRPKDRLFFEEAMTQAFAEGRRVLRDDGIGSVVFAHKTTEG